MAESLPTKAIIIVPLPSSDDTPPPPTPASSSLLRLPPRPGVRVTSEFDSDISIFFHKVSCKFFDSLAKFKLSFHNNDKGEISEPRLAFSSKYLSLHYDLQSHDAFLESSINVVPGLHLKAAHDVKAHQGEVTVVADIAGPDYKLEFSSAVPTIGMPKATFKFPLGEVSLNEKEEEEVTKTLSVSGSAKSHIMNGICTAQYNDENLNLRYLFKDEQMAFIPSISLPSNALSFAFKRQFSPSDKLSYWYNFNSSDWSAAYKHTAIKDYIFKAGYDSKVRHGWASLWVGNESGKTKTAPMKMKVQFMLQVPQDDIKLSTLMFRVKKRWDF